MLFSINVYATYIVCIYNVMFDLKDEYVNTEYIEDKRINVCWFKVSRIRIYEVVQQRRAKSLYNGRNNFATKTV